MNICWMIIKIGIMEDDLTHVEEILSLHDRDMDAGLIEKDQFPARCLNNINNRCLHHHVFDIGLLKKIYAYLNLEVIIN
ncbi:MAG: hypothetical protein JWP78_693 [Mucilaginibacter sp.]|nr:hypothetical protein [Mucilaginibacter sp.]